MIKPDFTYDAKVLEKEVDTILSSTCRPFTYVAFEVLDWQNELPPWPAPAVFGNTPFGDGAGSTLSFVKDMLVPEVQKMLSNGNVAMKCLLGGYSLGGLFALWCCHQTRMFHGIAAVSPSVWYPGWLDYAEREVPLATHVYLSLGDKEEKTKNPVMARVGDCIRRQHQLLAAQGVSTILEWNKGNHFQDFEERTAKGFAWLMNTLNEKT